MCRVVKEVGGGRQGAWWQPAGVIRASEGTFSSYCVNKVDPNLLHSILNYCHFEKLKENNDDKIRNWCNQNQSNTLTPRAENNKIAIKCYNRSSFS